MVLEEQVKQVLVTLYTDFADELYERYQVDEAEDIMEFFKKAWIKACRTAKK